MTNNDASPVGQQQEKTEQGGLDRSPAQFFFETGYFAAYAEACAEIGKAPFTLSDRIVERAWDVAGEAHDDRAEFDAYLARANGSAAPNTPASNDFVLVPREASDEMALAIVRELGRQQSYLGWEPHGIWNAALAAAPASPEPAGNEAPGRGGVWQPIETAPKDGTEIILAIANSVGSHWVHIGWWNEGDSFPWRFIDTFTLEPHGCCDDEDADRTPVNGSKAEQVTHWMPLPAAPAPGASA